MKKVILLISIIVVFFVGDIFINVIKDVSDDGYAYYGNVWQDTPEKALLKAAEQDSETILTLTPKTIFETTTIDDIVLMTFLSKNDTLVTVDFVSNENQQYSVHSWTEECDLDFPSEFLMTGVPNQFMLFPYKNYGTKVCGWCYSTAQFTVNGISPTRRTFKFKAQGKGRSIDFWIIGDFIATNDVSIDYL